MWKSVEAKEEEEDEGQIVLDSNLNNTHSSHFEDEYDGKKYNFDFNALANFKRRERTKILLFLVLTFVLAVALVIMVILYTNEEREKTTVTELTAIKAKLTKIERTSVVGDDCHIADITQNITKCGKNAFCREKGGKYFCDCLIGYVSDGSADCKDVHFAIDFKKPTTLNIPELKRVHMKQSDALSVCFWFKLDPESSSRWMSAFMFTSVEISGDNDLMVWLTKDQVHVYLRSGGRRVANTHFADKKWNHLCWMWKKTGQWWTYINGEMKKTGVESDKKFREPFPDSLGNLLLGQDKDEDTINQETQMLHGSLTQLYIYGKELTKDDIIALYNNKPPASGVAIGWWQFKNTTQGVDIVESALPKEIMDRDSL